MLSGVQEFCRHVQYLRVIKDDLVITIKEDWNTDEAQVFEVIKVPYKFELHLGLSNSNMTFLSSNAGFLISKSPDAILPPLAPQTIGGEINFFPETVDLNMARDTIIENDASLQVRASVSKAIKNLLKKAVAEKNIETYSVLRDILMIYLEKASQYEENKSQPTKTNLAAFTDLWELEDPPSEPPPLTSTEAAELLLDI